MSTAILSTIIVDKQRQVEKDNDRLRDNYFNDNGEIDREISYYDC